MIIQDIIAKKRDAKMLTNDEIRFVVQNLSSDLFGEEQVAALLMAIFINGLSEQELTELTLAMANSGKTLDLSFLPGIPVDKHSTGGVGDKLSLVIAPLAVAAGVTVAKMSGRGLGHSGGTVDKLEAIPGLNTELGEEQFLAQVQSIGLSIIGQSSEFAPADKVIYDLRNRTATVPSLPLIASSIMSKKIAAGCPKILLDVTTGRGAFMQDFAAAKELAETMVAIGNSAGRETKAILTNMEEPLGFAIGNALEIEEAIAVLAGEGPEDVRELALLFTAEMMQMAGKGYAEEQRDELLKLMQNGAALKAFRDMVRAQGGDASYIEHPAKLPTAKVTAEVYAKSGGYVAKCDALALGEASVILGAGRLKKGDIIDPAAGIYLLRKIGDAVQSGELLCRIYAAESGLIQRAMPMIEGAYVISEEPVDKPQLVLGRVG